jgi:hypothetical protein
MGLHCPFGHLKHKLWPKEGLESNWQFDSWPLKVRNRLDFRACGWSASYRWKALDKGYNFALVLISIRGLHAKLWHPRVAGVPTLAISGLPLGSPRTKSHLDVGPVKRCRVYYKGEGGGFPQVRVVVSLMCLCCPWFVLAPKVLQLCTNHLALVLFRSVWVDKACQLFLTHPRALACPSTLPKCCEPRNMPRLLTLSMFSVWDSHLSPARSSECIIFIYNQSITNILNLATCYLNSIFVA